MSENIIDSSDNGIVAKETEIKISDEKLGKMLLKAYEMAQKESNKFKLNNLWGICWSIAGTIFMALLTSSFNDIGSIDADTVTICAIVICAVFAVSGMILVIWRINDTCSYVTENRDRAVQRIIDECLYKKR